MPVKYGGRNETRWRNTEPGEIASVMAGISRHPHRWQSEKSTGRISLWALVAENVWPGRRVKDTDRLWLRSVYIGNRNSVQDLFRDLVDQPLFAETIPVAASTPKPVAAKFCICGEREGESDEPMVECTSCKQWYHAICISERISSVADNSTWSCPQCRGFVGNTFPDKWKHSLPLRRRIACDMTPVAGSSNQLGNFIQTVNQTYFEEGQSTQDNEQDNCNMEENICPHTVTSDYESDSDYGSIRRSKSRVGILDSDSESDLEDVQKCAADTIDRAWENLDPFEDYITWELPSKIEFQVTVEVWNNFLCARSNGTMRLLKGWTDYFRDQISKIIPQCGLTFECHKVYSSRTAHFHASGYCKAKDCISFVLTGAAPPTELTPMSVSMIVTGLCRHKYGEIFRTRIQNFKRDEVKAKLANGTSASIATELHREADMIAVEGGNMTSLPARKLLRQMRYEMNVKTDLAKDPLHDLQLMVQKDTESDYAFIRFYASVPKFQVVCFLDRSLDILNMMRKFKHRPVGHLDATGSLVRKLPESCGNKPVFVYSFVVTNPAPNLPEIPLMEFLSNSHTLTSISSSLSNYVEAIQNKFGPKSHLRIFRRIETDFSLAMIGGVVHSFLHTNLLDYLTRCWHVLFKQETHEAFSLHVCRAHVMKRLSDSVKGHYQDEECVSSLMSILSAYLLSYKMESVVSRVMVLLRLTSCKYITEDVQHDIEICKDRIVWPADKSADWIDFSVKYETTPKTIHKSSAFGRYFYHLLSQIRDTSRIANLSECTLKRNPYFNPKFRKYLMVHVFPYTPILTHLMMHYYRDNGDEDHQNPVENWNRHIKHDEHGRMKKVKAGRFLRASKKMLEGRYNEYLGTFASYFRSKGVRPEKITAGKPKCTNSIKRPKLSVPTCEQPSNKWEEEWSKKYEKVASRKPNGSFFDVPLIPWGTRAEENTPFRFVNTCTIDNVMMILTVLHDQSISVRNFLITCKHNGCTVSDSIIEAINCIKISKFNEARVIWVSQIMKKSVKDNLDLIGHEDLNGVFPLNVVLDKIENIKYCPSHGVFSSSNVATALLSSPTVEEIVNRINSKKVVQCPWFNYGNCSGISISQNSIRPGYDLPLLVFTVRQVTSVADDDDVCNQQQHGNIPKEIVVLGKHYVLFALTLFRVNHFFTLFFSRNTWYVYDGLSRLITENIPEYDYISSSWYLEK